MQENNNLFNQLKMQKEKMQKEKKSTRKSTYENLVQKYANAKKCIITAKIYKNQLKYDFQLMHFAKNGEKNNILSAIYGENAKEKVKSAKAYFNRNSEEKAKNQSGKSFLIKDDFLDILKNGEKELNQNNIFFAWDIIEKQKQKLEKIKEKQKALEKEKAKKASAKAKAKVNK